MTYDPFVRGRHPVGVRTAGWHDTKRDRTLPVEVYYPAAPHYKGLDLDPEAQDRFASPEGSMAGERERGQTAVRDAESVNDEFPLVIFVHGYSGDRREFTNLCTHLASHGYRVVSADHVGSTFLDVRTQMERADFDRRATIPQMAQDRLSDIPFMLNAAEREFGTRIERAGVTGASMGGWTSLIAPSVDARVRAIVPLCPGGSDGPLAFGGANPLGERLSFDWKAPAAVLTLVGDRDTWLPLYGHLPVFDRCPVQDKRLVVLRHADHNHFVDAMQASHGWFRQFTLDLAQQDSESGPPWLALAELIRPFDELMPETEALAIICGLATQHMDAHLKELPEARAMSGRFPAELASRKLRAFVLRLE